MLTNPQKADYFRLNTNMLFHTAHLNSLFFDLGVDIAENSRRSVEGCGAFLLRCILRRQIGFVGRLSTTYWLLNVTAVIVLLLSARPGLSCCVL